MSQIKYKYIEPLPTITPVNAQVVATDTLIQAIGKLQGQINAGGGAVGSNITVSQTAPINPLLNDLWVQIP